jgi:hypothetical protein
MKFKSRVILSGVFFAAGCSAEVPRADIAYRGNGDARILEFMQANYMSTEAGIAKFLQRHLEAGLQPGQVIDKPYLVQRGAACRDGTPVVCTFNGIANEHFAGLPKENAERANRVTRIEARVLLLQTPRVEVVKEESYPDATKP